MESDSAAADATVASRGQDGSEKADAKRGEQQEAVASDADFGSFLESLTADCHRRMQELPLSRDPVAAAQEASQERSALREAKALRRREETDKLLRDECGYQGEWRKQVQGRKEEERRQIAEQERAAQVALEAFLEAERRKRLPQPVEDNTPMGVARRNWAAQDRARAEEKAAQNAVVEEGVQSWLDKEWLPQLASHRQQLRDQRAAEARHQEELRQILQREQDAMAAEDASSSSFVIYVAAECERITSLLKGQQDEHAPAASVVRAYWEAAQTARQAAEEAEAKRREAELAAQRLEAAQSERDYQAWKEEVRSARTRRTRLEDTDSSSANVAPKHRPEMACKSYAVDKEDACQSLIEETMKRAAKDASFLQEKGSSARSVLEETRRKATLEKNQREHVDAAKAEKDLWESMLAKNRRARQQERESHTPRWGVFS